jgi:membrane-associated phospholipid phosphatase
MQNNDETISKKGLITIGIIFIIVLILGLVLIENGYNESFYSYSESVRMIFTAVTYLGEPSVFIIVIGFFYIVYNKRFAKNLALSLMASTYVNSLLKDIFQDPRPPSNIDLKSSDGLLRTSYGFPSGHNQTAVAAWGYIAYHFRKRLWIVLFMSVIIFLVGLSRLVIGAHDLQDVIGGFLIGLVLLVLFIIIEPGASERFNKFNMRIQILLIVIISLFLTILGTLLFPKTGLQLLENPPSFTDSGNYALVGGVLLGFGIGYLLENKYVGYEPKDFNNKQKIMNLVVGIVTAFVVFFGLESLKDIFDSVIFRYARYATVSFILAFLVPLILTRIKKDNNQSKEP